MKKIPAINGLRGMAILTVIAYHIWYPLVGPRTSLPLVTVGEKTLLHYGFLQNGQMAVFLFFIISGFVLALPYAMGTRTMMTQDDVLWFYKKRAFRLLPLYYLHLAIVVGIHNSLPNNMSNMLRDIFLMGTATFHFIPWMWFPGYNGVLWSIGSEIWFCVLMPGVLWAVGRYGMLRTMVTIAFFSLAMQWWGAITLGAGVNYVSNNVLGDAFYFSLGIAAAYMHVGYRIRKPLTLVLAGIAFIGAAFLLHDRLKVSEWHLTPRMFPVITTLFSVGCTALLLGLVHTKNTVLHMIFGNRPLQLIGMMSYSLYLWHPFVMHMFTIEMTPFNFFRMSVMLSLVGWLSYRYIEFGRVSDVRALLPRKPELTDGMSPVPAS